MFQKTIVSKYLQTQNAENLLEKWDLFRAHFQNSTIQENIRNSKEEQYQEGFLRDLFVKILGFTLNPDKDFNLTTEYKNVKDSKKADGAIIINDKVSAIIELKGTNTTDLSKIEDQAFGYKNNQDNCKYVITSNFEKLRFYVDNAIENIEFNLFELSQEQFNLMYLILAFENIKNDVPKKLKDESLNQEDIITKKLYKDYSVFKRELFQNLTQLNPEYDPLILFQKSQKLLDRLLFLFFGEDRGLLPPNYIRKIIGDWNKLKDLDAYFPLYDRYKQNFEYLNSGKNPEVYAYNGGLFKEDEILNHIKIDDKILYEHTFKLSQYDFASEVDVNILGHIFENSLNEIDEIKAELEGHEIDKSKSKRKKDGVFYTPKYITKYIVENTVGKLCEEKKTEFEIVEEEYSTDKKRQQKTLKNLLDKLDNYKDWLLQITIVDPACGSGAFLNEALNFLISEHQYIDELEAKLRNVPIIYSYHSESILENNLFGVDLNEESVEIAKLSLWLRTAERNRKLNSLNDNIKCGNSLIDDPEVAGGKAFKWSKEFPEVFAKGGFDVVIGNPPYVKLETMKTVSDGMSKLGYVTYEKRGDLYILFVEKGFQILKENGKISYIMPNKWLQAGYGKPLREFFLTQNLESLVDFGDLQIFDGATTYPCIFFAEKNKPKNEFLISVLNKKNETDFYNNVLLNQQVFEQSKFNSDTWVISSRQDKILLEKLNSNNNSLKYFINGQSFRGVLTGFSEAFFVNNETKDTLIKEEISTQDILLPFLQGRNLNKWQTPIVENYLIGTFPSLKLDIDNYSSIKKHLLSFGKERLKQSGEKGSRKKTNNRWFETQDAINYWKEFSKPKIMYQKFQVKPCFIYDETGLYCNDSMWIIPSENKSLVAILNSKMGWWLISKYCTQIQNGYQLIWNYFGLIPIPDISIPNNNLVEKADQMLSLNKTVQEISAKFQRTCERKFENLNLNKKLQDWYNLSYADFIKELSKQKIKFTLSEEAEWADYFDNEKSKALEIQSKIASTDKEIDQMVYELYGLSEEEIGIVENN